MAALQLKFTPEELRRRADWLEAQLALIPRIEHETGDWLEQHRRFRAACADLSERLRSDCDATVTSDGSGACIRMMDIRATCTAGEGGAFRNWIAAARRKAGVP